MRTFAGKITLIKNFRGVYDLDTSKGCYSGMLNNEKGCYNDCYAARYSKKYGYDFSKTVLRHFESESHLHSIRKQITKIDMPFFRMGVTGDPSENWEHTISIIKKITAEYQLSLFKETKKQIVIITKHWKILTDKQLHILSKLNICINTSISALDKPSLLKVRIEQYNRLKKYCKSVLRIISCDFNLKNKTGIILNKIQQSLFENYNVLDTILRVYKKNELVLSGVINIEKVKFLGKSCHVSQYNKNTYFGNCSGCLEMCGINS